MASEYWYKVMVFGGTEAEQDELLRRITEEVEISNAYPYGTQKWGSVWDTEDMKDFLIPLSAQYPHILIVVGEDCTTYDHLLEYFYFGNGKLQQTQQSVVQSAVDDGLLVDGAERSALPDELLRNGIATISSNGGLYKVEPITSGGNEALQIAFEKNGDREVTLLPLEELLQYLANKA